MTNEAGCDRPRRPVGPLPWVRAGIRLAFVILIGTVAASASFGRLRGEAAPVGLTVREPRLVVIKSRRLVHLFDGNTMVRSYPIDLGVSPVGPKRRAGDGRTPEGSFRIVTKNAASPYHRFIGIDYPGAASVETGLASGLISPGEAVALRDALASGRRPNWETALGGGIGLHGHRLGSDWTGGCMALSNPHIEELFNVLRIGDPIEIYP